MQDLLTTKKLTRRAMNAFVEGCARVAELHPFVWKLAWEAVHRLPFLLPHDKSYNAFRHFIASRPSGLFLDVGANDGISILSFRDRKSTRLNSSHVAISYAVFCLKKKINTS